MPFLLDVHFSSLDSQGIQCLETFFSKRKNYCAPHFWTTDFHILSSYQLANSLWVSFIFSYTVSFFWGCPQKEWGAWCFLNWLKWNCTDFWPLVSMGMISIRLENLLYHFVHLTILYSALLDSFCAWQCIKMWDFYYRVKVSWFWFSTYILGKKLH